jgi:hypothetical protein
MTYEEFERLSPEGKRIREEELIDILVAFGPAIDANTAPIHAVDKQFHWATADTRNVVDRLRRENRLCPRLTAIDTNDLPIEPSKWYWERCSKS